MVKRIDRHLFGQTLGFYAGIHFIIVVVLLISVLRSDLDMLLRGSQQVDVLTILWFIGSRIPALVAWSAPLAVYVTVVYTVRGLHCSKNLIPFMLAGVPSWRVLRSVWGIAVPVSVMVGLLVGCTIPRMEVAMIRLSNRLQVEEMGLERLPQTTEPFTIGDELLLHYDLVTRCSRSRNRWRAENVFVAVRHPVAGFRRILRADTLDVDGSDAVFTDGYLIEGDAIGTSSTVVTTFGLHRSSLGDVLPRATGSRHSRRIEARDLRQLARSARRYVGRARLPFLFELIYRAAFALSPLILALCGVVFADLTWSGEGRRWAGTALVLFAIGFYAVFVVTRSVVPTHPGHVMIAAIPIIIGAAIPVVITRFDPS